MYLRDKMITLSSSSFKISVIMEKTMFLLALVFVGMISLTDTHNKDDREILQSLIKSLNQNQENDARIDNKKSWLSNDLPVVNKKKGVTGNSIRNSMNTKQNSDHQQGQEYYVKFPERKSNNVDKDEDLYRAIDSFLHAERARMWLKWIYNYPDKGTSTTTRAPTTTSTVPTTEATTTTTTTVAPTTTTTTRRPSIFSWCKVRSSWFGWRLIRC